MENILLISVALTSRTIEHNAWSTFLYGVRLCFNFIFFFFSFGIFLFAIGRLVFPPEVAAMVGGLGLVLMLPAGILRMGSCRMPHAAYSVYISDTGLTKAVPNRNEKIIMAIIIINGE